MRQRIGRIYLRMPLNPEAERVSRKLYHLRNTVLRHCGYRPVARVGDRLMMIAVYGYTFALGRKKRNAVITSKESCRGSVSCG